MLSSAELENDCVPLRLHGALRGRFCEVLARGRVPLTFTKGSVLYEPGFNENLLFFVHHGVVSVGTLSEDGHEIIYDLRKSGDVAGELCASVSPRRDRAIALEDTKATSIAYSEILDALHHNRAALQEVLQIFASSLARAYDQTERLFTRDVARRVIRTLHQLAAQAGRHSGDVVEIEIYLTQEEISRMVGASRERVSRALNSLRAAGLIAYSRRGHLVLSRRALERAPAAAF